MRIRNSLGLLLLLGLFVCEGGFAGVLVGVSFDASGKTPFSGPETYYAPSANPIFGTANYWNTLSVPYSPSGVTSPAGPYPNLRDSRGGTTGISFGFGGPVAAYSAIGSPAYDPNLFSDFVYLNGGSLDWEISGLVPNSTVYMYFYDTHSIYDSNIRGFRMTVQGVNYIVDGVAGVYAAPVLVDASGDIAGTMAWTGGQASWAGFQFYDSAPEPSALLLLSAGLAALVLLRRRIAL